MLALNLMGSAARGAVVVSLALITPNFGNFSKKFSHEKNNAQKKGPREFLLEGPKLLLLQAIKHFQKYNELRYQR